MKLLLTVWLASIIMACNSIQEICIDSNANRDLPLNCNTLMSIDQFCCNASKIIPDNSNILLLGGTHMLTMICEIQNVINVTINGLFGVVECSSHGETGFKFKNVTTLKVTQIMFEGCGALTNATPHRNMRGLPSVIHTALLFLDGFHLALTNVTVSDSKSAGIYIYNVAGNVTIDACRVTNASSAKAHYLSGSVVAYDDNMKKAVANVSILNSKFNSSGYENLNDSCIVRDIPGSFLFSSGLSMFLGNSNLTLYVFNTMFDRNQGCNGGNLNLLFFKLVPVQIVQAKFNRGHSNLGGGVYASFQNSFLDLKYKKIDYRYPSNVLCIRDSFFYNNTAVWNGGGLYMHWKQSLILNASVNMLITGTIFERNSIEKVMGGLAFYYKVYIDVSDNPSKSPQFHANLDISNCTFSKHSPKVEVSNGTESENGVISATSVPYFGINGITVEFNNCTGILAIGSTLVFSGSTRISNNTASTGAGIRICSNALMYLTHNTDVTITNNFAWETGGGMQVYFSDCLTNVPMCFFQYSRDIIHNSSLLETINFTVSNNHALKGGSNIFGGSIDFCFLQWIHNDTVYKSTLQVPKNTMKNPSSISSAPQQVCLNDVHENSDESFHCKKKEDRTIYPGEAITIFARVVGQYNGSVQGTVLASGNGVAIEECQRHKSVRIYGQHVVYNIYSTSTSFHTRASLRLRARDSATISYYKPAIVSIKFKNCPFGFSRIQMPNGSHLTCSCSNLHADLIKCNISLQTITKQPLSWVGMFELKGKYYLATSAHCPLDYCNNFISVIKSNRNNLSQDVQCQYNRTGILCGSCPEGWSLVLGSSECREKCSNIWLLLVIPFALAGLVLVAVIHFLNLTVTKGTVCGLIFYANIVQDYSITLLSKQPIQGLTPILQVFLSWFNLDLGITTCFYNGMDAVGKAILIFIFPVYIWLISATIIFFSNRYFSVTRLVGEDGLKVLSTLFLLSYSKMLRAAMGTTNLVSLAVDINGTIAYKQRWILDGNISYFNFKHVILLVIAALFIVFALPFTMSLLCIRHVFSLSNYCRLFSIVDKLKPFFDTYTGSYKDKARFWTGLLLFARLFLLIVHALDYSKSSVYPYFVIIAVCLLLMTIMVFFHGVYKQRPLNILEHFFILNITIIFLIHTYYKDGERKWVSYASHSLVGSAFIVFLGILVYHLYIKLSLYKKLYHCITNSERNSSLERDSLNFERMKSYSSI